MCPLPPLRYASGTRADMHTRANGSLHIITAEGGILRIEQVNKSAESPSSIIEGDSQKSPDSLLLSLDMNIRVL